MLHIHIDELDDEVFTPEEEELQMCLQLDRWGEVSLVLDDSYTVWGMNRAVANCVVIRWDLPAELTAPGLLQLMATLWTQLEKVHRGHTVSGQGEDATGKLDLLGAWAQDAVSCLIEAYQPETVSVF